ncbi:hypothetical protein NEF87_003182 [Candidatus Lokiarchaeum ossiferum]|uniref:HTH hxlR-type domain-containing protein n=1 Tax=Candidatus Lokiarchaeum ossiferum TaxID=2951803 RepID=A0ABY6HX23_9ARCH|nr:hypothetical protein NEF87_003182 [Candidatus Lokiarchaeum sp. B-35]
MDINNQKIQANDSVEKHQSLADAPLEWHCISSKNNPACQNNCFTKNILSLFGKKHTLQIIRLLLDNKQLRFNEILNQIGGSPKTITERLRDLEKRKLIIREVFNEIPMRVQYSLTDAGKDLEDIFERISLWAKRWMD